LATPMSSPAVSAAIPAHRFRRHRPLHCAALRAHRRSTPPFFFYLFTCLCSFAAAMIFSLPCRREAIVAPPPNHRPPRRSCTSFFLERDRPQATTPSVTEEKATIQSPVHRAPPHGMDAPTVPRGRLRHHNLSPSSPPVHDLRAGTLHHSSGLPPVVPSRPTHTTMEHPSPMRFSLLRHLNQIPREPDVILDQIPRLPVPPVHRIPTGSTTSLCHGLLCPLPHRGLPARAKSAQLLDQAETALGVGPYEQCSPFFRMELIQICFNSSNLSKIHRDFI
jgi:hypothetical protein